MKTAQTDHANLTEAVRSAVRERLAARLNSSEVTYSETVLLREGNYCGRCFRWGGWAAIWTLESTEIRFYDSQQRLIDSVPTPSEVEEHDAARSEEHDPSRLVNAAA